MDEGRRESEVSNGTASVGISTPASSLPPSSSKDDSGHSLSSNIGTEFMMDSDLRRGSVPVQNSKNSSTSVRRFTLHLHQEYLTCQSSLFRKVLSSTSPLDLSSDEALSMQDPQDLREDSSANSLGLSEPLLLTPTAHPHPVIFLPVPDPCSFIELVKYLYFGRLDMLGESMRQGSVRWEGVIANAQLLGLNSNVKRYLGVWFKENANKVTEVRRAREMDKVQRRERAEREIEMLTKRYDSTLSTLQLEKEDGPHQAGIRFAPSKLNAFSTEDHLRRKRINSNDPSPTFASPSLGLPNPTGLSTSPGESQSSSTGEDSDTTMKQPASKVRRNSEQQRDISSSIEPNRLNVPGHTASLTPRKTKRPSSASTHRGFNSTSVFGSSSLAPSSFIAGSNSPSDGSAAVAGRRRGRIPRPHSRA